MADQGREARHPFLAEAVVALLLDTPLPLIADLRLPPGEDDSLRSLTKPAIVPKRCCTHSTGPSPLLCGATNKPLDIPLIRRDGRQDHTA